jgi:hypothetical protein
MLEAAEHLGFADLEGPDSLCGKMERFASATN